MIGRPVAMHAMRGISAHSNGFHTCRAIHMLQMLLGTIDCPGGFRYKPPFPRPAARRQAGRQARQVKPGTPLPGPPLGFVTGPEDLLVDADGTPQRIDKAYSWDAPLGRPRPDAHGHHQRLEGRSLSDRRAVHVHGQHELELVDERAGTIEVC
jgi:anaerobic selenocysteine-containing dehydrogenase